MKDALAVALVHFIWQGAVLALVGGVLMRLARVPAVRYAIGVATVAAMLTAPAATFLVAWSSRPPAVAAAAPTPADVPARTDGPVRSQLDRDVQNAATPAPAPAGGVVPTSWILGLWAFGVCLLSLRFIGGLTMAHRLATAAILPVGDDLQRRAASLASRLAVRGTVRVCTSALVAVPVMIGWLRPVVVLPPAALASLPIGQLEALLAHEFAHIRRHDYLVNLLQTLVETLCFYHPAVWWMSHQVRLVREECCDDVAVSVCDRLTYVTALSSLARLSPQIAMAATGGSLRDRVRRLVEPTPHSVSAKGGWMAMLPILLVVSFAAPQPWGAPAPDQTTTARRVVVEQAQPVVVTTRKPTPADARPAVVGVVTPAGTPQPVVVGVQSRTARPDARPVKVTVAPVTVDGKVSVGVAKAVGPRDVKVDVTQPASIVAGAPRVVLSDARPMAVTVAPGGRTQPASIRAVAPRVVLSDARPIAVTVAPDVRVGGVAVQTVTERERQEQARRERAAVAERVQEQQRRRLRTTEAELATLEVRLRDVEITLNRQRELFDRGLVTRQTLEATEMRLADLRAQLELARTSGMEARERAVDRQTATARQQEELLARGLAVRERAQGRDLAAREALIARGLAVREDRARAEAAVVEREALARGEAERRRADDEAIGVSVSAATPARAGDRLIIEVAGEPDLPSRFTVREDGSIRFPFLGVIRVQGSTASQIQSVLQKLIADKGLGSNPRVAVSILRARTR